MVANISHRETSLWAVNCEIKSPQIKIGSQYMFDVNCGLILICWRLNFCGCERWDLLVGVLSIRLYLRLLKMLLNPWKFIPTNINETTVLIHFFFFCDTVALIYGFQMGICVLDMSLIYSVWGYGGFFLYLHVIDCTGGCFLFSVSLLYWI